MSLTCEHGCSLGPATLAIVEPDGARREVRLEPSDGDGGSLALTAPPVPGRHTWTFELAAQTGDGVHDRCATQLTLDVVPHVASLAVWSLPDAAIAGERFRLKAGASSTAGMVLAGQRIEILNASGETAGSAVLGDQPWEGTSGLLWAEVEAVAPAEPGIAAWTASIATGGLALPHEAAALGFTVAATAPPRHRVEIDIVDKASGAGIEDALVRVGAFRATTDAAGRAVMGIAEGTFDVLVWKTGYDVPTVSLEAGARATLKIEAVAVPEEDPDAHWKA